MYIIVKFSNIHFKISNSEHTIRSSSTYLVNIQKIDLKALLELNNQCLLMLLSLIIHHCRTKTNNCYNTNITQIHLLAIT